MKFIGPQAPIFSVIVGRCIQDFGFCFSFIVLSLTREKAWIDHVEFYAKNYFDLKIKQIQCTSKSESKKEKE